MLSVIRWRDYDAMIEQANGVDYGLAAGLYPTGLTNAMRTEDHVQVCCVQVNPYSTLSVILAEEPPLTG